MAAAELCCKSVFSVKATNKENRAAAIFRFSVKRADASKNAASGCHGTAHNKPMRSKGKSNGRGTTKSTTPGMGMFRNTITVTFKTGARCGLLANAQSAGWPNLATVKEAHQTGGADGAGCLDGDSTLEDCGHAILEGTNYSSVAVGTATCLSPFTTTLSTVALGIRLVPFCCL